MPYYQQGPEDYYGPQSGFDPFTGRLQGGQLVMQFLNQLQSLKDQKQQREWAGEDRDINKRLKEAQISNYYETSPVRQPAQKGYKVPPQTLKEVAAYYNFPEKEWGEYDPEMQKDMVNKYLTAKGSRTKPVKPTTTTGAMQSKRLEEAARRIENQGRMYSGALTQLMANPMNAQLAGDKVEEYRNVLESFQKAADEITAMKERIDEDGELSEKDYARLQAILKVPETIRTSANKPKAEAPPRPGTVKGETATSPTGQVYEWDGSKWVKK